MIEKMMIEKLISTTKEVIKDGEFDFKAQMVILGVISMMVQIEDEYDGNFEKDFEKESLILKENIDYFFIEKGRE